MRVGGGTHAALQEALRPNNLLEDVFPHVSVDGRQRIIQQIHGAVAVHRPGQTHTLLLTAR